MEVHPIAIAASVFAASFSSVLLMRATEHKTAHEFDLRAVEAEVRDECGGSAWRYDRRGGGEFVAEVGEDGHDGTWSCALVYDKDTGTARVRLTRNPDARPRTLPKLADEHDGPRNEVEDAADGANDKVVKEVFHTGNYSKTQEEKR